MPRAKGVCSTPGCPNLQPCATHKRTPWAGSTRRQRLPADWEARRRRQLARDGHRCVQCGAPARDVDHVNGDDDHDNLQSLCRPCHQRKTLAEARAGREGPPPRPDRQDVGSPGTELEFAL